MVQEIYKNPSSTKATQSAKQSFPLSRTMLADLEKDLRHMGKSFFAGFDSYPKAIKFESQETKEQIILLLRRHFITNIPWILMAAFLIFLSFLFPFFGVLELLPGQYQMMTYILWYLLVAAYVIEKTLSWLYNVYIITDERIVDIDFYSLVYKRISEAKIEKIEDVTYIQGGFIQSLFDFGTVTIQTAAEKREFEMEFVPQPSRLAKVLNQLILQEEQEKIEGRVN